MQGSATKNLSIKNNSTTKSPFKPRKHDCGASSKSREKENSKVFTREEIASTLQHLQSLKSRTAMKISGLQRTKNELQEQVCYLKDAMERQQNSHKSQIAKITKVVEESERKLSMQSALVRMQADQIEQYKDRIRTLQQKLIEAEDRLQQHKNDAGQALQLEKTNHQEIVSKMRQDYEAKVTEIHQLRHLVSQIDNALGSDFQHSGPDGYQFVQQTYGGLKALLTTFETEKAEHQRKKVQLQEQLANIKTELSALVDQKQQVVESLALQAIVLSEKSQTIQRLTKQTEDLQSQIKQLQEQLAQVKQRLVSQITQHSNTREELKHKEASHQQQQACKSLQIQQLKQKIQVLNQREEYQNLVQRTVDDKQDYARVNCALEELSRYRTEYYNNIDKIQFLCERLQQLS